MRFTVSFAVVQLLLVGSTASAAFFPRHVARSGSSSTFGGARTPTRLLAESDPYAKILDAYQKKSVVPSVSVPDIPNPPPAVVADVPSSTDAVAAASEAAQKAAAAAAEPARAAVTAKAATAGKALTMGEYIRAASTKKDAVAPPYSADSFDDVARNAQAKFGIMASNVFGEDNVRTFENEASKVSAKVSKVAAVKGPEVEAKIKEAADLAGAAVAKVSKVAAEKAPEIGAQIKGAVADAGAAVNEVSTKVSKVAAVKAPEIGAQIKGAAAGAGAAVGSSVVAPVVTPPDLSDVQQSLQILAENLHLKEYGPWYGTAAALMLAIYQRQSGKEEARAQYEEELALANARAEEAAAAASVAAKGAALATNMAKEIGTKKAKQKSPEQLIESSKIREMEVERDMMRIELKKVTAETAKLRSMLNELLAAREEDVCVAPDALFFASESEHDDLVPVTYMTMDRDPDEDARILAVVKELDEGNAPENEAPAPKAKKSTKSSATSKTSTSTLTSEGAGAVAKKTTKKAVKTVKRAKRAIARKRKVATKKVKEIKVKMPEDAPEKKTVVVESTGNPWGSLSDSTLHRKTVAQLTAYLAEREISITDESGKVPKKAELVSAVRSL